MKFHVFAFFNMYLICHNRKQSLKNNTVTEVIQETKSESSVASNNAPSYLEADSHWNLRRQQSLSTLVPQTQ